MNLRCDLALAAAYRSASQVARILSEDWCNRELYCPACDSDRILRSKANTPAADFACPRCKQLFELKSLRTWNPKKIVDAGYDAMVRSIRADRTPHLLLLQYNPKWYIRNVLLVPRMFLTESVIEKRRPLSPAARRAGWVGCNILLRSIPSDGKIAIVSDGAPEPEQLVRREFERIKGLAELSPTLRGWTVDVLNSVRQLGKSEFSLNDVYAIEPQLRAAHPNNRNVRPKIRQQLQVLRNIGLIEFKGRGNYSLRE
jgi:type II restriction enzyme